jgi:hypothetical protein
LPELPGEDEFIPTPEKASFGIQTSTADTGTPDAAGKAALLEARSRVKRAIEQVKPQGEPLPSDIATEVSEFTAEEIAAGEDRFRQLRHSLGSQNNAD